MPLPTTRVIHPSLADRHAPTLGSVMTADVVITRPGTGETYDPGTGTTVPADGTVVYEGRARVAALGAQASERISGGAQVTTRSYLVELPLDEGGGVRVGDRVVVSGVDELVSVTLTVADVAGASTVWSRAVRCTGNLRV